MELTSLTVILTDRCNFNCAYCYQPRGKQSLDFSRLAKAVDFLYPFFAPDCLIHFYGGEPLLAFDLIERAVDYLEALAAPRRVNLRYSLTTNGSLLNDPVLGFLDEHRFSLMLSFDGLAQEIQRKKGSFDFLASIIPRILSKPGISLETNSVFSSETIGDLSESVQFIIRLGVQKLDVNFAPQPPWTPSALKRLEDELSRLGEYFLCRYEKLADIPWSSFYGELQRAVYYCPAGRNQMALSAQGTLWGCPLFPHYFLSKSGVEESQKYCFGDVDSFSQNPRRIYGQKIAHYSALQMSRFSTPDQSCLICGEIEQCWICPLAAAQTTGEIGRIPAWSCQAVKILRKEKSIFLESFRNKPQRLDP